MITLYKIFVISVRFLCIVDTTLCLYYTRCAHRSLTVAASTEEENERWLEDLVMTITQADTVEGKTPYLSLKSCSKFALDYEDFLLTCGFFNDVRMTVLDSADEISSGIGLEPDRSSCGGAKASQRSNTTVHVCWHRNTTISYSDQLRAFQASIYF